ncbi:MAG: hypothetical protein ACYS5V_17035 [Planctomycetota bacterium]
MKALIRQLLVARSRMKQLERMSARARSKARDLERTLGQIDQLQKEASALEQRIAAVEARRLELRIQAEAPGPVTIAARATS